MNRLFFTLILVFTVCASVLAQTVQAPDTLILKRTPVIDGIVNDSEWDIFYESNEDGNLISTYANWDNNYFYFCVKTSQLSNVAMEIDCAGDEWPVGNDNYMFKAFHDKGFEVYRASEDIASVLFLINPLDQSTVICEQGTVNGEHVVEVAIPVATVLKGFSLKPGTLFGFNIAVQTANKENAKWVMFNPADMSNNCISAKLVTSKTSILGDMTLDFSLEREIITAGESLDGKIRISNKGTEAVTISDVFLVGDGACEKYVNAYKILVGNINSKKTFQREYHTGTSSEIGNGTWVLSAEVYSGDIKVGAALKSFEVVPSVIAEPITPKVPVYSDAKEYKVGVKLINYAKNSSSGDVTIVPPDGWVPKGGRTVLPFKIYGYKKVALVEFKVVPPIGAFGEANFKFNVKTSKGIQEIPVSFRIIPAEKAMK